VAPSLRGRFADAPTDRTVAFGLAPKLFLDRAYIEVGAPTPPQSSLARTALNGLSPDLLFMAKRAAAC
jgi:hypothetical protein